MKGVTVLVLFMSGLLEVSMAVSDHSTRRDYTNSWAVEIKTGDKEADTVARRYGFINLGKVGNLERIYHFELPVIINSEEIEDRVSRLKMDPSVSMMERQYHKHMVPKKKN